MKKSKEQAQSVNKKLLDENERRILLNDMEINQSVFSNGFDNPHLHKNHDSPIRVSVKYVDEYGLDIDNKNYEKLRNMKMMNEDKSPDDTRQELLEEVRKKLRDDNQILWCTDCEKEVPYGDHGMHIEYLELRDKNESVS